MNAADELQGLWITLFGEPPFIRAEARVMAKVLVSALPAAPPYKPGAAVSLAVEAAPGRSHSAVYLRAGRG